MVRFEYREIDEISGHMPATIVPAGSSAVIRFPFTIIRSECGLFSHRGLSMVTGHSHSTGAKPFICEYCGRGFTSPSGKSHHRVYRHGRHAI